MVNKLGKRGMCRFIISDIILRLANTILNVFPTYRRRISYGCFMSIGKSQMWVRDIKSRLKLSKAYLKTDYKAHVSMESECADHCRVFALSDPESNSTLSGICRHEHTKSCTSCDEIRNVLAEVEATISLSPEIQFR